MRGRSMKKSKPLPEKDDLRPEYRREDLGKGVRGKYYKAYTKGTNLVLLSPDVAAAFLTAEAVNEALRSLIQVAKASTRLGRRAKDQRRENRVTT
jgi:hypothetical protein